VRKGLISAERKNPKRKEVRIMTYNKPEVLELASAVDAIQGSSNKGTKATEVIAPHGKLTSAAYEADE
jgi:hypothetical protein